MDLDSREKLLLTQAVYEYGNNAWEQISQLLVNHPLLSTKNQGHKFNPPNCKEYYDALAQNENIDMYVSTNAIQSTKFVNT